MKKVLLTMIAALAMGSMSAQTWTAPAQWTKTLAPVTDAKELGGTHTAVAADGTVITTGTYNKALAFGSTTLPNDEAMTSAYVAKYNADGSEAWIVGFYGAATVKAVDTDAEGNVYVAGNFADEVVYTGTDKVSAKIMGKAEETAQVSAFIAKLDKDGVFKAMRTIIPVPNADLAGFDMYFYETNFRPKKIQVDGEKVYVSASHQGDVAIDGVNWKGSCLDVEGWMYMDIPSMGILSLSAADLQGAASVAHVQSKGNPTPAQYNPEDISFVAAAGTVYAAIVGKGTEVLVTPNGSTDLTMNTGEEGMMEHAFILASIGTADNVKIFHTAMHDRSYGTDYVKGMALSEGRLYVAGTFYNQLGFDTEKTSTGSADMFVATVNPADFSVYWAVTDGYDEGSVTENEEAMYSMLVNNGNAYIAGAARKKSDASVVAPLTWNIDAHGTITAGDNALIASMDDNGSGVTAVVSNNAAETTVTVYTSPVSAISGIAADEAGAVQVYSLDGTYKGNGKAQLAKGLYIVKNGKTVKKFIVK